MRRVSDGKEYFQKKKMIFLIEFRTERNCYVMFTKIADGMCMNELSLPQIRRKTKKLICEFVFSFLFLNMQI